MEIIYVKKLKDVKRMRKDLEKKLNLNIVIKGPRLEIEGDAIDEYEALKVFEAINFGFSVEKAMLLKHEDFVFKKVHIKEHTRRNLKDIKARLIGTHGKTRKTMSDITDCEILIGDSEVGVIGEVEAVEDTTRAIVSLIGGSKQSNMYRYLERMNREKKKNVEL